MKKIVFTDIDGTLLDNLRGLWTISAKTRYAFEALKEKAYVFLSSGRTKCMLPDDLLALKPDGLICANGAYAEMNGHIIYERCFADEQLAFIKDYCLERSFNYYLENPDAIYCNDIHNLTHQNFIKAWGLGDIFTDEVMPERTAIHICMLACPKEADCPVVLKDLEKRFDVRKHHGFPSFDINLYGTNKGTAVKEVLKYLNIAEQDAYAFGDGRNDIEMIKNVKYGIAMGNAVQELKDVAYLVAPNVLDDGFYHSLVSLGLIKAGE